MPSFAQNLEKTLHAALDGARERRHEYATLEHLLLALIADEDAAEVMGACGVDLAELAEAGNVQVEYRPYELLSGIGDYSRRATNAFAVVLEESGPEVAKRFHDLLFDNQPSESGPFPDNQDLLDLAVEAGADEADVSEGILEVTMRDWVDAATAAAVEAGVQGTPTVILDGKVVQGGPQDILDAVLEATA